MAAESGIHQFERRLQADPTRLQRRNLDTLRPQSARQTHRLDEVSQLLKGEKKRLGGTPCMTTCTTSDPLARRLSKSSRPLKLLVEREF